ncbi:MAG: RNA-binding domain-containing protein [Nitrososphaerota archaeon]
MLGVGGFSPGYGLIQRLLLLIGGYMHVRVSVRAEVFPTEDLERVLRAVRRIFPTLEFRVLEEGGRVFVEAEATELSALKYLKENWRMRRVRSAVGRILRSASSAGVVRARLSKHAAYVGMASLLDEDERPGVGEISLEVETEDVEGLIKWLTS